MIALALQSFLGAGFLALGLAKLVGAAPLRAAFERLRLPRWLRLLAGGLEVASGAALLASVAQPFLAFFAAALLGALCLGAILAHALRGPDGWAAPALLLGGLVAVALLQPLGLRVLMLPRADALPAALLPSQPVLTADPGTWFESVAAAPDGTLYLAANAGLDHTTGDTSRARGWVIALAPGGTGRTLFDLPAGATAGGLVALPVGGLALTVGGEAPGVWRTGADGALEPLATLPPDAWPNEMDLGPDGALWVADSRLGTIWRVNPTTGAVEAAVEDDALRPRPFIALAPGANGLRWHGRNLYVTVSDKATVLRLALGGNGRLGPPEVVATGIPGDDLAVAPDGTLFVTTHPYDTVVRIAPDGSRTIVTGARGATAAAFGRGPDDAGTLHVVTDGGAFAGDPTASGVLVRMDEPE